MHGRGVSGSWCLRAVAGTLAGLSNPAGLSLCYRVMEEFALCAMPCDAVAWGVVSASGRSVTSRFRHLPLPVLLVGVRLMCKGREWRASGFVAVLVAQDDWETVHAIDLTGPTSDALNHTKSIPLHHQLAWAHIVLGRNRIATAPQWVTIGAPFRRTVGARCAASVRGQAQWLCLELQCRRRRAPLPPNAPPHVQPPPQYTQPPPEYTQPPLSQPPFSVQPHIPHI